MRERNDGEVGTDVGVRGWGDRGWETGGSRRTEADLVTLQLKTNTTKQTSVFISCGSELLFSCTLLPQIYISSTGALRIAPLHSITRQSNCAGLSL